MSQGLVALQEYTTVSKYAKYLKEHKRREVWPETVERYQSMMLRKYPHRGDVIREVCKAVESRQVMPSMRGLQYGGHPIEQHNARLYNCSGSYCDRLAFFPQAMYMSLCGSGVGTSVQERHIKHLPKLSYKRRHGVTLPRKTFQVQDCIEGWADASAALLSSFHEEPMKGFEEYYDCDIDFDPTLIRPKGAELSSGVGRAPGPDPLMNCLYRCRGVLMSALLAGLDKLDSIHAFDYFMHEADAGVSGGVRRSATIVLFDRWDMKMVNAKTGNWFANEPQRGRANISALLLRNEVSFDEFLKLFEATKQWGEPGFYWADHADALPNPCVEIGFWCKLIVDLLSQEGQRLLRDYQGPVYSVYGDGSSVADGMDTTVALSGWQMCNLTTMNGRTIESAEDFYRRCEQAARLGTWQAGFDRYPYLGEVSEKIVQKEALLGVSISGMMHHPELLFDPEVQRKGASTVLKANEEEAGFIGINPCARGTCVKPDGNSAAKLGGFSGAMPGKMKRGMRIVQTGNTEAPYLHFRAHNPQACEPSKWSANKSDDAIRFCVEYDGVLEEHLTAVETLKFIKSTQVNWVGGGKRLEACTQPWLSNNVSNTVRVRDHEWEDVARTIFNDREAFAGVSLISWTGDRDYVQAPFTSVYDETEQYEMYGAASASDELNDLLERAEQHFDDLWDAAELVLNRWKTDRVPSLAQTQWELDLNIFALTYFYGDDKKATYCLKDAFNWRLYCKLKDSYQCVEYKTMVEEENGTDFGATVACAGGVCLT